MRYEKEAGKDKVTLKVDCQLVYLKKDCIGAIKPIVSTFFESGAVTHFSNYIIPGLDTWLDNKEAQMKV